MGKDAHQIRTEIEATRDRLGDTAEAIGYKADVPSRVRDAVGERVESAKQALRGSVETISSLGSAASDASEGVRSATARAIANPLGLAVGAWSLGFLIGYAFPISEVERRSLGPLSDKLAEQIDNADLVEHGKQVLHETTKAAVESAREHAGQVMQEMAGGSSPG